MRARADWPAWQKAALPRKARTSTVTSEPREISGRGGSGSAGVMGEETAME
ncbi:MAG: hypothetical protein ACYDHX_11465 [Methanothrix sp.]